MRIRFSIAGLMVAVLVLAVGFAALRAASPLWANALFTLTVILFAAAILGASASRGPSRIAWLGFGVFGWTYLLATFWLWPAPNGVIRSRNDVAQCSQPAETVSGESWLAQTLGRGTM